MDLASHANHHFLVVVYYFSGWQWVYDLGTTAISQGLSPLWSIQDVSCTWHHMVWPRTIVHFSLFPVLAAMGHLPWDILTSLSAGKWAKWGSCQINKEEDLSYLWLSLRMHQRRTRTWAPIQYWNMPTLTGLSLAQKLFGRPTKTYFLFTDACLLLSVIKDFGLLLFWGQWQSLCQPQDQFTN